MQSVMRRLGLCLALVPFSASAFERPPPSEGPMEPCPSHGSGFFRIPGSATCIRLSGRVRAGADIGPSGTTVPVRGRIAVETRSEFALGPVRSFVRIDAGHR